MLLKGFKGICADRVIGIQPRFGGDREAGVFQSFFDGIGEPGVHLAGTSAAPHCVAHARTVGSKPAGAFKGEPPVGF